MILYKNDRLTFEVSEKDIKIEGIIDEYFLFSSISFTPASDIVLDLAKLEKINSCGIREFISWLTSLPGEINVNYINCPIFFINQSNMVHGIVSKNRKIVSFYCPYFNEEKDEEVEILTRLEEIVEMKAPVHEGLTFDSIEKKFFNFLILQNE